LRGLQKRPVDYFVRFYPSTGFAAHGFHSEKSSLGGQFSSLCDDRYANELWMAWIDTNSQEIPYWNFHQVSLSSRQRLEKTKQGG
jgi:hypothetical protein